MDVGEGIVKDGRVGEQAVLRSHETRGVSTTAKRPIVSAASQQPRCRFRQPYTPRWRVFCATDDIAMVLSFEG